MKKFMQIEMSMLRTGVALAVALLCGQSVRSERIELSAAFGCYGIELPDFPRREFRIDDYGARTGELCTTAINAAMRECSLSGGMLGLFLLGCVSKRVSSMQAAVATGIGIAVVAWTVFFQASFHANLSIVFGTVLLIASGFLFSLTAGGNPSQEDE